jgi:hypothetical protein
MSIYSVDRKKLVEAFRLYRITEKALYRAEMQGRTKAADRLRAKLIERDRHLKGVSA